MAITMLGSFATVTTLVMSLGVPILVAWLVKTSQEILTIAMLLARLLVQLIPAA